MDFVSFMQDLARTRALVARAEGAARVFELSVEQGPLVEVRMDSVLTDRAAELRAALADVPQAPTLRARVMGRVLEWNHARARRIGARLQPQLRGGAHRDKADRAENIWLHKTVPPREAAQSEFLTELVQFARFAAAARTDIWAVLPRPTGFAGGAEGLR